MKTGKTLKPPTVKEAAGRLRVATDVGAAKMRSGFTLRLGIGGSAAGGAAVRTAVEEGLGRLRLQDDPKAWRPFREASRQEARRRVAAVGEVQGKKTFGSRTWTGIKNSLKTGAKPFKFGTVPTRSRYKYTGFALLVALGFDAVFTAMTEGKGLEKAVTGQGPIGSRVIGGGRKLVTRLLAEHPQEAPVPAAAPNPVEDLAAYFQGPEGQVAMQQLFQNRAELARMAQTRGGLEGQQAAIPYLQAAKQRFSAAQIPLAAARGAEKGLEQKRALQARFEDDSVARFRAAFAAGGG